MKATKYLLIGGGLASSQAAKQLRESDAEASILLIGEEPYVPYDRPPLSKEFLRGQKSRDELFFDPERYFHDSRIDLALGTAVKNLNPSKKTVGLSNGETLAFEKVLIATGGRPVHLEIPGSNLPDVYYLRTLDDSAAIAAEAGQGKRAVVIGGGFVGMEVAASLTQRGVQVFIIEAHSHIWPRFVDATMAGFF
jgi:3-phenylpropionate/trans-cinnamate dioxygenase ferredoxin reductase component